MTFTRGRTESGREREKRNDTHVKTLRDTYGAKFAPGAHDTTPLGSIKKGLGLEPHDSLDDVLKEFGIKKTPAKK